MDETTIQLCWKQEFKGYQLSFITDFTLKQP
jgi:hypothetical protein